MIANSLKIRVCLLRYVSRFFLTQSIQGDVLFYRNKKGQAMYRPSSLDRESTQDATKLQ